MRLTAVESGRVKDPAAYAKAKRMARQPSQAKKVKVRHVPAELSLHDIARQYGIRYETLRGRLRNHPEMSPEEAAQWRPIPNNKGIAKNPEFERRFGMSLSAWARKNGIDENLIRNRVRRHPQWSNQELLQGHPHERPAKPNKRLGVSVEAFAAKHGLKPNTVWSRMAKHPDWTPEQIANYQPPVNARLGMTINAFAEMHGLHPSTVRHRMSKHPDWTPEQIASYQRPAAKPKPRVRQHLTREQVARIKHDLRHGFLGVRALAKKYGVASATVSRIKNGKSWADVEPLEAP